MAWRVCSSRSHRRALASSQPLVERFRARTCFSRNSRSRCAQTLAHTQVFAKSDPKAVRALVVSVTAMTASMWFVSSLLCDFFLCCFFSRLTRASDARQRRLLYMMPWFLLPLGWLLAAVCALGVRVQSRRASRLRFVFPPNQKKIVCNG